MIRTQIPILFDKYKIRNILDAPCGDFNGFKKIVNKKHDDRLIEHVSWSVPLANLVISTLGNRPLND